MAWGVDASACRDSERVSSSSTTRDARGVRWSPLLEVGLRNQQGVGSPWLCGLTSVCMLMDDCLAVHVSRHAVVKRLMVGGLPLSLREQDQATDMRVGRLSSFLSCRRWQKRWFCPKPKTLARNLQSFRDSIHTLSSILNQFITITTLLYDAYRRKE